jgi:RND superfamily putative drug exporter
MLAGIANLTELGFGVAVGIVIAAFGMAPLLVPALSALEGRVFWWPRSASKGPASPGPDGVVSPSALQTQLRSVTPVSVSGALEGGNGQSSSRQKSPLR